MRRYSTAIMIIALLCSIIPAIGKVDMQRNVGLTYARSFASKSEKLDANIRILSIECAQNPTFILYRAYFGSDYVDCYSEVDSDKCQYFKNNFETGSTDYKTSFELSSEKIVVSSIEYTVAVLELYQEVENLTRYESFQVLERFLDKQKPYVIVKESFGSKYAMLVGRQGLDYSVGSCFYHEYMPLDSTIDNLKSVNGNNFKCIPIGALSGTFCMKVISDNIVNKKQYWIVEDVWGFQYAVPNSGHNFLFKDDIDLSKSKFWSLGFLGVVDSVLIENKAYPVLMLQTADTKTECEDCCEDEKGSMIDINLICWYHSSTFLYAKDRNNTEWEVYGPSNIINSLKNYNGSFLARGRQIETGRGKTKHILQCYAFEKTDYFEVFGAELKEGTIKEVSLKKDKLTDNYVRIFDYGTSKTDIYTVNDEIFPAKLSDLKIGACIRFSALGKQMYYCEKMDCKAAPKPPEPPKKGNYKGNLFFYVMIESGKERTWYMKLTDCDDNIVDLQYSGWNFPPDRRTGENILKHDGECAYVEAKGKEIKWWETTTEPCCDKKPVKSISLRSVTTYKTLCQVNKTSFVLEIENKSKEKLTYDIVPDEGCLPFDPIIGASLNPLEKKNIEISVPIKATTRINKYVAKIVSEGDLLASVAMVAIAKSPEECDLCGLEPIPLFDNKKPLCEGEENSFVLILRNNLAIKTIQAKVESLDDSRYLFPDSENVVIEPWETKQITIKYRQPKSESLEAALFKFKITSDCGKSIEYSFLSPYKTADICKPCCDFELDAPEITANLCQNEEKTFKINVSNACGKEKQTFKVQSLTDPVPLSIEPNSFELEAGKSEEVSVKVKHASSEEEIKWKLGIYASCGTTKSLEFTTKIKTVEECDPCYGFGFRFYEPLKIELCEGEEGNVLVFLYNSNTTKTMDVQIKVVVNSEKPETIEKNKKLLPNTKASIALIYKQPKKTNKEYVEIHTSVSFCGKTVYQKLKSFYKPDSVCNPCCDFKIEIDKKEFSKVKTGDKLKAILTITNTCNLADQYTISGSAGISFSATKAIFCLANRKK